MGLVASWNLRKAGLRLTFWEIAGKPAQRSNRRVRLCDFHGMDIPHHPCSPDRLGLLGGAARAVVRERRDASSRETVLMFASFLAHKNTSLHLQWVILVAIAAAVSGDNAGFFLGRHFGTTLIRWAKKLFRLDDTDIQAARAGPFFSLASSLACARSRGLLRAV